MSEKQPPEYSEFQAVLAERKRLEKKCEELRQKEERLFTLAAQASHRAEGVRDVHKAMTDHLKNSPPGYVAGFEALPFVEAQFQEKKQGAINIARAHDLTREEHDRTTKKLRECEMTLHILTNTLQPSVRGPYPPTPEEVAEHEKDKEALLARVRELYPPKELFTAGNLAALLWEQLAQAGKEKP